MRTVSAVGVLLALSSVTACRGSNNDQPDAAVDSPAGIHIQDVQSDAMAPGTAVELHGVIVTAIDTFGDKVGQDIWVQEPGGGERSGVHVFRPPAAQVANLAVGNIVDITGAIKSEFKSSGDNTGRTVTELQAPTGSMMTVTKTGTGTVPDPHIIDVVALEAMSQADRDAVYEKWEGVLIKVQNVRAGGPPGTFGMGPDAFKVQLNGDLFLESNLAMLPGAIDGTTCFASITGVEDYIGSNWTIYPRSDAEITLGGTSCPPAMGPPITTITAIQAQTPTGAIELDNVYVMALTNNMKSFWISTSLTAAPTEGVFVFQLSTATLDPGVVPGARVNVVGTVQEFNDDAIGGALTEIRPTQIIVIAGAPGTPVPVAGQQVTTLLNAATATAYESVLVTLDNVAITAIGNTMNGFVATGRQNGTTFGIGTDILHLASGQISCYTSITGFWTNLEAAGSAATMKPNAFGFIPLTLAGEGAQTCN